MLYVIIVDLLHVVIFSMCFMFCVVLYFECTVNMLNVFTVICNSGVDVTKMRYVTNVSVGK